MQVLSVLGNPFAKHEGIRDYILKLMPSILAIDQTIVMDFERTTSFTYNTAHLVLDRFKSTKIAYHTSSYQPNLLQGLKAEFLSLKRLCEKVSPVLTVQNFVRMLLKRVHYLKKRR